MERLTDPAKCREVTDKYPRYFTFDVEAWFADPNNHAYMSGDNVGFGELKSPGVYWVHLCLDTARGREAIEMTKEMVRCLHEDTNFNSAIGLIVLDNKRARWLIRQVGFTSLGEVDTKNGMCEMFYMPGTKVLEERNKS